MQIHLDRTACQGHGRCYSLAPGLFDCDDDGYAVVGQPGELDAAQVTEATLAAQSCPELAITIE
jgi:ferredoxin